LSGEEKKGVLERERKEVGEGKIIIMRWYRATTNHFVKWFFKHCKGTSRTDISYDTPRKFSKEPLGW
jgi:hypothetical protein